MKKSFNAKAARILDTETLKRHFDPHADAWLVLGRVNGTSDYFVAWQSRHCDALVDGKRFNKASEAQQHFESMIESDERSEHPYIEKDWQQDTVYDWEEEFIFPLSRTLDDQEIKTLTRRIARDYKIPASELVWGEDYEEDEADIETYKGNIDIISFLHEMAHHVHDHQQNGNIAAHHSPGFVAVAIALYHRYAGIELEHLGVSACSKKILGDPAEARLILISIETGIKNGSHGNNKEFKPAQRPQVTLG